MNRFLLDVATWVRVGLLAYPSRISLPITQEFDLCIFRGFKLGENLSGLPSTDNNHFRNGVIITRKDQHHKWSSATIFPECYFTTTNDNEV